MQELEKILEEIKSALKEIYLDIANNYDISDLSFDDSKVACVASKFRCTADDKVEKIIHKHIFSKDTDITNKCGDCSRRKWYQKGYDDGKKNDGWIPVEECLPEVCRKIEEDHECPEYNVTIQGAEKATTLKYSPADETWFDDMGYVYPVVAWQPLPEVYHPERSDNHDRE